MVTVVNKQFCIIYIKVAKKLDHECSHKKETIIKRCDQGVT